MVNTYEVVIASGTRMGDFNSTDQTNDSFRGAIVVINVGAVASGSVVATIEGKDLISAKYYTVLASTPIISSGTTRLTVYPGLTAANNTVANYVLPQTWRVSVVSASGTSAYSVGASLIG